MKILLIQPPIQDFYDTDVRLQPIGLAYLKAAIKNEFPAIEVIIKDYHHSWGRRTIQIPNELKELADFYQYADKSPFALFNRYYHFGAAFETIAKEVAEFSPEIVGISSNFTPYYKEVLQTASAIKKVWHGPIIVGGAHVSADPQILLNHPGIDFVIQGEGEISIVEFIRSWRGEKEFSDVPKLGFKKNSELILNEMENSIPIENLPMPDFSDFDPIKYKYQNRPLSFITTSRGCPYHCTFCSVHQTFGNQFRQRSVDSVINELEIRYDQGYRIFDFEDDNINCNHQWFETFPNALLKNFKDKDVEFCAMNGMHYLHFNRKILSLMKMAGFKNLNISLVSSDEVSCKTCKRPFNLEKYDTTVNYAFSLGLEVVSYQILGLPGETLKSMTDTLIYNARLPVRLGVSPFYVTPGMPVLDQQLKNHQLSSVKARLTSLGIESKEYEKEDIYTMMITARIINFLKEMNFQNDVYFSQVLNSEKSTDKRSAIGIEILNELFKNKKLYASTSGGFEQNLKFKIELFFNMWHRLKFIKTYTGKSIFLE